MFPLIIIFSLIWLWILSLQAISSHSLRRSLFEHYVKTRAEEERKEKRAAQKASIDGFKQLLQEASEVRFHSMISYPRGQPTIIFYKLGRKLVLLTLPSFQDIDQNTNYNSFKRKWGDDTRCQALNRKDIEVLLNERLAPWSLVVSSS